MFKLLSSLLGSGAGLLLQRLANRHLTGKEREQNQFNADQAVLQREFASSQQAEAQSFNASEAEKSRAFQANQAATQWQRGVADMRAAGLNPALAYGQGGASAMQGVSASVSPSSGSAASGSAQLFGLSDILEFAKLKKDLDLMDEQIKDHQLGRDLTRSQINRTDAESDLTRKQVLAFEPMNKAQLDNLLQDLDNKKVKARLDEAGISESEASAQLKLNQAFLDAIDISTRHELNTLNVRLRVAEIGESKARTNRITAEINELYQRAILEAVQSGQLDQQTRNLAIQEGILRYDEQSKKFEVDHQKADRNWRIAGQVVNSVVGVAGVAVGAATGAGYVGAAMQNASTNAARLSWQQSLAAPQYSYPIGF